MHATNFRLHILLPDKSSKFTINSDGDDNDPDSGIGSGGDSSGDDKGKDDATTLEHDRSSRQHQAPPLQNQALPLQTQALPLQNQALPLQNQAAVLLQCCLCGIVHPLRNERGQAYEHMCAERRRLEANVPVVFDVARSIADMHFSRVEWRVYEEQRFRMDYCRAPIPLQNQALPLQNQALPLQNQAPPLRNQAPRQHQALPLQNQAPPLQNQAPPLQNQAPPLQNQAPPPTRDVSSCSTPDGAWGGSVPADQLARALSAIQAATAQAASTGAATFERAVTAPAAAARAATVQEAITHTPYTFGASAQATTAQATTTQAATAHGATAHAPYAFGASGTAYGATAFGATAFGATGYGATAYGATTDTPTFVPGPHRMVPSNIFFNDERRRTIPRLGFQCSRCPARFHVRNDWVNHEYCHDRPNAQQCPYCHGFVTREEQYQRHAMCIYTMNQPPVLHRCRFCELETYHYLEHVFHEADCLYYRTLTFRQHVLSSATVSDRGVLNLAPGIIDMVRVAERNRDAFMELTLDERLDRVTSMIRRHGLGGVGCGICGQYIPPMQPPMSQAGQHNQPM